jgi:hypothetical protein
MIETLSGVPWPVFLGLTVGLFGGCAFLTGQAMAQGWRPWPWLLVYGLLLGVGDRFLSYALFQGPLTSLPGFLSATLLLTAIAAIAYRLTLARLMVTQYPWLYRRTGPLTWRPRDAASL